MDIKYRHSKHSDEYIEDWGGLRYYSTFRFTLSGMEYGNYFASDDEIKPDNVKVLAEQFYKLVYEKENSEI